LNSRNYKDVITSEPVSNINGQIISSVIINILVTLSFMYNPDYPESFLHPFADHGWI